jgi:ribonucleoside-diphosphate reductase alpha chain
MTNRAGARRRPVAPEAPPRITVDLSPNARLVLEERYLRRDDSLHIIESPEELFWRVARAVADVDARYGPATAVPDTAEAFFTAMARLEFLPNTPTLMNAGTPLAQCMACFVLPIDDSLESIFDTLKLAALIQQTGGGTGFAFSRLRPRGDIVRSTKGVASGPVSFMAIYNAMSETIKQGSKRRGANMGVLRVDHPDIREFITCKRDPTAFTNFNISVGITDAFMQAVDRGEEYALVNPRTGSVWARAPAREIWDLIVQNAWESGEPGLLALDTINRLNPTRHLGEIEATNPCVTGDTLIYTGAGLQRAADLAAQGQPVEVVVDGEPGRAVASPVFRTGRKPVFRLITAEGYELRLTADHRVLTRAGWVPARDLRPGDEIRLLSRKGGFGTAGSLALGRLLGWLVGDGSLTDGRAVLKIVGAEKRELAPAFAEMMAGAVPDTVTAGAGRRGQYSIGVDEVADGQEARVRSTRFWRIAAEFGLHPGEKHKVPEPVLTGSEEMQRGFLQALFTADGHVGGSREHGLSVRLTSISRALLQDVQRLLLNFGIVSCIFADRRAAGPRLLPNGRAGRAVYQTSTIHDLVIARDHLLRFASEIGFLSQAKQSALTDRLASHQRGPFRETFYARFLALVPDGEADVYDLIEPSTHSFVANGLVVHNCAEEPLHPYEACCLGSINLSRVVARRNGHYEVDWSKLGDLVRLGIHFLDNVVDLNAYPAPQIADICRRNRRIGLGVMGWADLLVRLGIPYDSDAALRLADEVMGFIAAQAQEASAKLAEQRGVFPNFPGSSYDQQGGPRLRNATTRTIAPTGTISIIANCSSGIEPLFALAYVRRALGGRVLAQEPHPVFREVAEQRGFYSETLMRRVVEEGRIQALTDIPPDVRRVFVTAMDIAPEWHVRMQAVFQRHVDNGVSKTINLPPDATVADVDRAYRLAYELGAKGITVYRYGSRPQQVLSVHGYCLTCAGEDGLPHDGAEAP